MEDILFARNQRLVSEIESSLKDYRSVVVPWGAMHLAGNRVLVAERATSSQSGEVARKALGFW